MDCYHHVGCSLRDVVKADPAATCAQAQLGKFRLMYVLCTGGNKCNNSPSRSNQFKTKKRYPDQVIGQTTRFATGHDPCSYICFRLYVVHSDQMAEDYRFILFLLCQVYVIDVVFEISAGLNSATTQHFSKTALRMKWMRACAPEILQ